MRIWIAILPLALVATRAAAHPLASAVRSLAKASSEMMKANDPNIDPIEMRKLVTRTDEIWAKTILLPLKSDDAKFAALGVEFLSEPGGNQSDIKSNDNATSVLGDAYALRPMRWQELSELTDKALKNDMEIMAMIDSPEYSGGIALSYLGDYRVEANRIGALQRLSESAHARLGCISKFSRIFAESGFVPMRQADGSYTTSTQDLLRVYHTSDVAQLTGSDKARARAALQNVIDQIPDGAKLCIEDGELKWLYQQSKLLE